ncbi:MAG: GMP synthase [Bacteroidetes bacterium]|nr:GMP synthase [Bacteroidota bacterium]
MNYKIAILDLYDGHVNQGMRGIKETIEKFGLEHNINLSYEVFDLRGKGEIPAVSNFDVFISSGGPGSPLDSVGSEWEKKFFNLVESIQKNNASSSDKKYLFLICHSFQIFCRHYNYGLVCERKSTSFGVLHAHKTEAGIQDKVLRNLGHTFYIVDSRKWQVIQPNPTKFFETKAEVLALEKERPLVPFERALMAIRFSEEIFGTQFHPEADGLGMRHYLLTDEEKKKQVIEQFGEAKYLEMIDKLDDEDKIILTHKEIIPNFLEKKYLLTNQQPTY